MNDEIKTLLEDLTQTMSGLGLAVVGLAGTVTQQNTTLADSLKDLKKDEDEKRSFRKQQKAQRDKIREEVLQNLGLRRDENKKLRVQVDERERLEKEAIKQAKDAYGEEGLLAIQRRRFLKDELSKLEESNRAYGGMVKSIADLNQTQREQLEGARRNKKFQDELSSRGYIQDSSGKLVKTQTDLTNAQKAELANLDKRIKKENDASAAAVKIMAEPGKAMADMSSKFKSVSDITGLAKNHFGDMAGGSKLATGALFALESAANLSVAALTGFAKAGVEMSKSLLGGQRGMAVGARAVATFTKEINSAVQIVGSGLIGLGAGIAGLAVVLAPFTGGLSLGALAIGGLAIAGGAAAKAAGNVAETMAELNVVAAETNDKLFAGFKELGKMSMTGARGMEGVINNLHKMGLTVAEFDKFKSVISANAREMKMFGVTAEQGVNKFAEAAGGLFQSEMGRALELMGIGAEEQYEHTAKYMALQSRLGLLQEKNTQQIIKSTKAYVEELDAIATITGATRKEQEDARNVVMSINELRAGLLDEQRKLKQATTEEEKKAIQERIRQMETGLKVATTLQAQGLTRQATGAAKFFGAGGIVTGPEAAEFFQTQQNVIKGVREGKSATELSIKALQDAVSQAEKFAGVVRVGADLQGLFGDSFAKVGDIKAFLEDFTVAEEKRKSELEKQGKIAEYDQEKFLKEFAERRKAEDSSTAQNVDASRAQMKAAITLDKGVFEFNKAVGINAAATKIFAESIDKLQTLLDKVIPSEGKAKGTKPELPQAYKPEVKPIGNRPVPSMIPEFTTQKPKQPVTVPAAQQPFITPGGAAMVGPRQRSIRTPIAGQEQLVEKMKSAGFTDPKVQANILAQIKAESGGVAKSEDLKRYSAKRLYEIFPGYFKSVAEAEAVRALGEEAVGNRIYGGRMGNAPNEGFKYRGRGLIQLTGKENYEKFGKMLGIDLVGNPELANDPEIAQTIAIQYFKEKGQRFDLSDIVQTGKAVGYVDQRGEETAKRAQYSDAILGQLQQAKTGGLLSGPESGYPVLLHGKELVIPMPDTSNLANAIESVAKTPLSEVTNSAVNTIDGAEIAALTNRFMAAHAEVMDTISSKLDSVIDKLSSSNDIQDKILTYSRA